VIEVRGLDETLRALRTLEPKAMSALRKGFKQATTPILDKAKAQVPGRPLSRWGRWNGRLDFNQAEVQKGLRAQVSVTKRRANLRLINASAPGAVFETAGNKNDQKRTHPKYHSQSRAFNRQIIDQYGEGPRLLVKTWKQEKGIRTTFVAVKKLIADAEAEIEKVTAG
jgi:hypothetical protein